MKILMVCLGNICRSPLAEGILRSKVEKYKLDWEIDSAGTSGWHSGEKPDQRSIDVALQHGIDISKQSSRKFYDFDIERFDLIYAMDVHNYNDIIKHCKNEIEKQKVKLILNELFPNENRSVPDPYYGGAQGFKKVYDMLNEACENIVEQYK